MISIDFHYDILRLFWVRLATTNGVRNPSIQGLGVMSPGQVPQNMLYLKALIGAILKKVDTNFFYGFLKPLRVSSRHFYHFSNQTQPYNNQPYNTINIY